jgi:acyl-coenzyme A synthetase/AMP-(fatty) acid ligase
MSGGIGEMSVYNLGDDLVDRHVREGRGDRLAHRVRGRHVTYRELCENVNRVGQALTALAVGREERVLLVLLDSPNSWPLSLAP